MKFIFLVLFSLLTICIFAGNNAVDKTTEAKDWLKNQPLAFIENKGQFTNSDGKHADNVLFKASYGDCDIYITTEGLSYVFLKYDKAKDQHIDTNDIRKRHGEKGMENKTVSYYRLDMNLQGAAISKTQIIKELPGKQGVTNYFYPNCPEGIYGVQEYGKITIKNIYKGIDWVIYTNAGNKKSPLKYDFVVHPQADYKDIRIKFVNAQSTSLTDNGSKLKIQTIAGTIEEGNLYSYQENSAEKKALKTSYLANADSTLAFEIGAYDKSKTLVIDPLVWATYYGGWGGDDFFAICTDSQDNIYITGDTYSSDYPTQPMSGAYWQVPDVRSNEAIIIKFNKKGVRQWATFYGGMGDDYGQSIYSDYQDNIYITGSTTSANFPTKEQSGAFYQPKLEGSYDLFILKFNNQGNRQWATYYGGSDEDRSQFISGDIDDNIIITGNTYSLDFPTLSSGSAYYQANNGGRNDVFILKFNSSGQRQWATYYGGYDFDLGNSLCTDNQKNIFITGSTQSEDFPTKELFGAYYQKNQDGFADAFILKFNALGILQWATHYGGTGAEEGTSICSDNQNNVFITGSTASKDFPVKELPGSYFQQNNSDFLHDIFISKFNNTGVLQWATYYGGLSEYSAAVCCDKLDNIYVTGISYSGSFPTMKMTGEYWQPYNAGSGDVFILKFNEKEILQWATLYGGEGYDVGTSLSVDHQNSVYFVGQLMNSAFTIDYGNNAYYDDVYDAVSDGFILKITNCSNQKPTSVQTNRNNLCIYDNGNITLTAIGGTGDTLKWYSDNLGINCIGKNTPLVIPSPMQTTTYYARWESTCDTSACDSIVINIYSQITKSISPVICQGDTCTVGASKYTKAGIYTDTLFTTSGCDSIVTTNLSVNPAKQLLLTKLICEGEIFTVGANKYNTTGNYTDHLKTYLDCDSTVVTNLVVNPTKRLQLTQSICQGESFIVGTKVHTTAGIYSDTLSSVLLCDSIVTTNLVVNLTKQTPNNPIICEGESAKVGAHIYTISGSYVDKLSTTFGCDSIVTTNLIVGTKKQNLINQSICQGESFPVGNNNYTKTGTYTDVLQTMYGCDSVVTTNLTVDTKIENHLIRSICEGENFQVGIHIYTTSGNYTDNLKAWSGCDSIVTTDLKVNSLPVVSLGDITTICPGDTIFLSPGQNFNSYLWSDGSVLSDLIITGPGTYNVTVYNDWCPASAEISIDDCGIELWFPNAFSPDNDGINERFKPMIKGTLGSFQILIFNKWGQKIFESTDALPGWDGTYKGSMCPADLYVYIAYYSIGSEPSASKQRTKRGSVTLLR